MKEIEEYRADRQYYCSICGKGFTTRTSRNRHTRTVDCGNKTINQCGNKSMWINLNVTFVIKNYHQGVAGTDTRGQCINPSKHKVVQVENVKCVCVCVTKHSNVGVIETK